MKFAIKITLILLSITLIFARSKLDVVKHDSPQLAGEGLVQYLDRTDISCPSGAGVSYFQYFRDLPADKYHYSYTCRGHAGIKTTNIVEKQTTADHTYKNEQKDKNGTINFLDKHHVMCPKKHILQQFKLHTVNGGIFYKYRCAPAIIDNCWNHNTPTHPVGDKWETYYLDRHNQIKASGKDEVIRGFRLVSLYSPNRIYYSLTICKLKQPNAPKNENDTATSKYNINERNKDARRRRRR